MGQEGHGTTGSVGNRGFISPRIFAEAIPWMRCLLIALSVFTVVVTLFAAHSRIPTTFEHDWIEDGMLSSVRHVASGLPLYAAPSTSFTPYLYTPLFVYAAAALAKLTGISFVPLRLISFISTLGCYAAIYTLVFMETRRRFAAIAAVGCFAACYPIVLEWFDIGRVDMFCLCITLWALVATRRRYPIIAALLWVCAFQAKQGILPVALLALCCDWQRPRQMLIGGVTFLAGLFATIAWLTHTTGGWYKYYVFGVVGGFGFDKEVIEGLIPYDFLTVFGIAVLIILAAWVIVPPRLRSSATTFYVFSSFGMIVFTGYIRIHRGAYPNSLLPAYAWIAVLFGIALARLYSEFEIRSGDLTAKALFLLLTAATVQLAMHVRTPHFPPNRDQLKVRQAFVDEIRAIPGDVLLYDHPELGLQAGKGSYASGEATGAVIDAPNHAAGDPLIAAYWQLIHEKKFNAVGLDLAPEDYLAQKRTWLPPDFLAYYPLKVPAIGADQHVFGSQPQWIYFPCSAADVARKLDPMLNTAICDKPAS